MHRRRKSGESCNWTVHGELLSANIQHLFISASLAPYSLLLAFYSKMEKQVDRLVDKVWGE